MAAAPIADQSAALTQGMAGEVPADALETFREEQAALDAAGVPDAVLEAGSVMPDARLLDVRGDAVTLEQARAGRPAVVVFYRGAWCPYCNVALRTYQRELAAELDERGVALIAVSPQKPDGSLSVVEVNELSYTVLSDPGNQVGRALGIVTRPSDRVLGAQASLGLDVAGENADGTSDIVMPTVVIVDAAGVVRWIDVHPNYTTRTEPAQILAALRSTVR
ncbi:peroxiredoxin-like family protein [Streptomyces olivaceus]|uniref:thioredoxin-dependent peroxiredoxin n=1 Tax=Streptomyces olivaceus TaxID=47716 RepID=A0ABS7W1D7_STROV|nr:MULTISPECIES: peroxiredoxin-like family protein [Streptomyces]MBZ6088403.1 AhpC/TSA family protein [Streptomyces olivaceus]MBZ6094760.1 AhpC/TSA family protein [Streptomyces olivaceus]MBZ6116543.1 AhpC/TSA family protein [Streptomyces olivaceus]MBZ6151248.1 AhpC/TSA family protein [Streptomyces olivaceus]MBZ6208732.1 AhpC/TSA family protein [Streptomyces olivaceus]